MNNPPQKKYHGDNTGVSLVTLLLLANKKIVEACILFLYKLDSRNILHGKKMILEKYNQYCYPKVTLIRLDQ